MDIDILDINKIIQVLNRVHKAIRYEIPKLSPVVKSKWFLPGKIVVTELECLKFYEVRDCVHSIHNLSLSDPVSLSQCIRDLHSYVYKPDHKSKMSEACSELLELLIIFQKKYNLEIADS